MEDEIVEAEFRGCRLVGRHRSATPSSILVTRSRFGEPIIRLVRVGGPNRTESPSSSVVAVATIGMLHRAVNPGLVRSIRIGHPKIAPAEAQLREQEYGLSHPGHSLQLALRRKVFAS